MKIKLTLSVFMLLFLLKVNAQQVNIAIEDDFSSLKLYKNIEAVFIPSTTNKIVIAKEYENLIRYKVSKETLKLKLPLKKRLDDQQIRVKVYAKSLTIVDVNEGSFIEFQETTQQQDLTLNAQEGAVINALIDVENLHINAVTGGEIIASGSAKKQTVKIRAGGSYQAKNVEASKTTVSVSAGGRAEIRAKEFCKARVNAGGTIEIYDEPSTLDKKISLGGTIVEVTD